MERGRQRKLRTSTTIIQAQGNQQILKSKTVPKLVSENSSRGHVSTKEDLGCSFSKRVTGMPMKKFLGEEMSKETETNRRSSNVVAKLMGLDMLPSRPPVHIQRNRLYEGGSNRKSSIEHQEFKDVYEDLEASHFVNHRYSSKWTANSKLKKLDTDEFDDTCDTQDSNKDLMLKFLQQPDSLFVKHLLDLKGSSKSSLGGRIGVLKTSDSVRYEINAKSWKSERENSKKHEDVILSQSYNAGRAQNSLKSSKVHLEAKGETGPTRIVVLKPNLEKAYNAFRCNSSPDSSSGSRGKKDLPNDLRVSRPNSREAKEIAKNITRQIRNAYSGVGGYAGDESSYRISGSDSAGESATITLPSRNSLDWNDTYKPSSCGSSESFLIREAKKRLSERWKMIHKYRDTEVIGKGSTLGEMLAMSDSAMRRDNLDAMMRPTDGFSSSNGTSDLHNPLGISSGEGWNDSHMRKSSRSRSLPRSALSKDEVFVDDRLLKHNQSRTKEAKGYYHRKEDYSYRNVRSSNNKSQSAHQRYACSSDSLPEITPCQNQTEIHLEKNDRSEQQPMFSETLNSVTSSNSVFDAAINTEYDSTAMPKNSSDVFLPELSMRVLRNGDSSARDQVDSNSQEQTIRIEPESSESCKEADQPSPVSVLEVPSLEDVSSGSECFERVSAELQELRKQLQLLKMESESCGEAPMLTPDDESGHEPVIGSQEREILGPKSWKSYYLDDILIESGFDNIDSDKFTTKWHSLECPLDPTLFEDLEKTYNYETNVSKSERRLLFDRVNSAFWEIFMGRGSKWLKPGVQDELNTLLERQEKEASEDDSVNMLDREMHWLDFSGDDIIGTEIEKSLMDELIAEIVVLHSF